MAGLSHSHTAAGYVVLGSIPAKATKKAKKSFSDNLNGVTPMNRGWPGERCAAWLYCLICEIWPGTRYWESNLHQKFRKMNFFAFYAFFLLFFCYTPTVYHLLYHSSPSPQNNPYLTIIIPHCPSHIPSKYISQKRKNETALGRNCAWPKLRLAIFFVVRKANGRYATHRPTAQPPSLFYTDHLLF